MSLRKTNEGSLIERLLNYKAKFPFYTLPDPDKNKNNYKPIDKVYIKLKSFLK